MANRAVQPAKLPGTTKNYTWDFLSDMAPNETISTQVVTMSVYSGTDASPSSMISGIATVTNTSVVNQKLTAGVLGVIYEALCKVTTSLGQTLEQSSFIAVVPDLP